VQQASEITNGFAIPADLNRHSADSPLAFIFSLNVAQQPMKSS
jgi:hypothetical protein